MKRTIVFLLSGLLLGLAFESCAPASDANALGDLTKLYSLTGDTGRADFTSDWTFMLGDDPSASETDFDDSSWRHLNLPHDWAIEGDFSKDNPSGTSGGALPGGIGWYRKAFHVSSQDKGKELRIDFDGVYMNSTVFLNGNELGTRPYGYISFSYDLTPYINWDGENVIAVRVDNEKQPNSRWYSGCGIYRNVWLTKLNPVHVAQWGTYITTEDVSAEGAKLTVRTTLQKYGDSSDETATVLLSQLLDADGVVVGEVSSEQTVCTTATTEVLQEINVVKPHLWDVDDPYMYSVRSVVSDGKSGEILDTYYTPVGIRYFEFNAENGFFLNGKHLKINGVCMHHDLGCLGSAVNARAVQRQLNILKEMGCNGLRTSHNPPAPELLDLCDRMGFIVMDETLDMWRKRKTAYDYSNYFNQWHERDISDMLLRDRNHPCVFMWSIGNEVLEQWNNADADTLSLEQANLILNFGHSASSLAAQGKLSVNALLAKKLADIIKSYDTTRPVTAGCNEPSPDNNLFQSDALDIIGFNYHESYYETVPELFLGKPFLVSESVSSLMTRGYYVMPSTEEIIRPNSWDKPFFDPSFSCSSYDNCHVPWGITHEKMLSYVKNTDFISGQYIWTGFDYIGEPTPYRWPAHSSYFGIVDLAGFPKDVYYMYQSEWCPDKTVLHLFPHWNWTEGEQIDLWAYYNNADEVELFVNGKSQGVKSKGADDYHVMWSLTFEPGTVKVVSRKDGVEVASQEIRTAGEPAQIRLTPDRNVISANGKDLSFITVEVLDADGNLCPLAENDITFAVEGSGFIAGVDNGCQTSLERFKDNHRKAFYGKCLLVVQNTGNKGAIRVSATSEGLAQATVKLSAK